MSFTITNYCPSCGAPIWLQDPTEPKDEPGAVHFSCNCKSSKISYAELEKRVDNLEKEIEELKKGGTKKKTILND